MFARIYQIFAKHPLAGSLLHHGVGRDPRCHEIPHGAKSLQVKPFYIIIIIASQTLMVLSTQESRPEKKNFIESVTLLTLLFLPFLVQSTAYCLLRCNYF